MHKTRWAELSPLLDELLDQPAEARVRRLDELRRSDAAQAAELQALLAELTTLERDGFLEQPAPLPQRALAGRVLGAYTVEREIGQGGMGTVWLARRTDGRFEGHVAVKVLSGPLHGRGAVERFEREGRMLGRLAHPNIARLIDAGLDGSQPYLIIEYVDGQPIDRYCEAHALDTQARVRLFLAVLAAVAHAHARLILHRDLKPGNILVSAAGEVKLLDFGIGKLLDDTTQPAAATALTQLAGRAFTPRFAAPEQLEGGDVTTATDVYALGVLLYLLLAGVHPTDPDGDGSASPLTQMRLLLETVPRRLSDSAAAHAAAHGSGTREEWAAKRVRELRGDLDTIVAKALKKAPAERYANAEQMAEDLQRWLVHEPIAARPDAALYRMAKFVRRHRVGAAATGLVLGAAAVGVAGTLWQAHQARLQQVQAEGLIEFMLGDLRAKLTPVGRLDVLDSVGERVLGYYAQQDAERLDADSLGRRARALHLLGEIAQLRGQPEDAARMFDQAAASTAELLARHPDDGQRVFDHAQSVFWVGHVAYQRGQLDSAERSFQRYRELAERLAVLAPQRGEWQAEVGMANSNLGTVLLDRGRPAEALAALTRTRETFGRLMAQHPALTMEYALNFGWIAKAQEKLGALEAALQERQRQLDFLRAMPDAGRDREVQRALGVALGDAARHLLELGRIDEALARTRERIALLGPLAAADPQNRDWQRHLTLSELQLAEVMHLAGDSSGAREHAERARRAADALAGRGGVVDWQVHVRGSALVLIAALDAAEARDGPRQELGAFTESVRALRAGSTSLSDRESLTLARAHAALGDLHARAGRDEAARIQWQHARKELANREAGTDFAALAVLAQVCWRLGEQANALALLARIESSAFRHPAFSRLVDQVRRGAGPQHRS